MSVEVFSWSRLETYKRCPARYAFAYLEQRPPEAETLESVLGKLVHEVLAGAINEEGESENNIFWKFGNRRFLAPMIRVVKPDMDWRVELEAADSMIAIGLAQIGRVQAETVAVEQEVRGDCDGIPFVGHIDWLTQNEDGFQIRDWKTSRKTSQQRTVDADGQLALYEVLLRPGLPILLESVSLHWHFLRSDTVRESTRTSGELRLLEEELAYRAREITAAREFPYNPGPLCGWCEYRGQCPASPFHGEDPETRLLTP